MDKFNEFENQRFAANAIREENQRVVEAVLDEQVGRLLSALRACREGVILPIDKSPIN